MTGTPTVAEIKDRWIAEIDRRLRALPELQQAITPSRTGERLDFCVWLGLPEETSSFTVWGAAIQEALEHFEIRVIASNNTFHSRRHTKIQLSQADLIVMLAVTDDVAVESLEICRDFCPKTVVCYPTDHVNRHIYRLLTQEYKVEAINFTLNSLEEHGEPRLGVEIFGYAADCLLAKRAERARKLRLQETVIVLVNGILSRGTWQGALKREFNRAGFIVESTNYGWFDIFRFLLPICWIRHRPIRRVWQDILHIKGSYPDTKMSFLAHSFGTFIVGKLFELHTEFQAERIALCGSILRFDFPFRDYDERYSTIVNDVGCKDPWPALAESVTWGYGSTGTYGFNRPGVNDRWDRHLGHRQFMTPEFCVKYWVPIFFDGTVVAGDDISENPSRWVLLISAIHIKYLLLSALLIRVIFFYWFR